MSPKKLSEADKNEILRLYRHSPETTSTLASLYGVSSSTISRFLKSNLPETEYEVLIQQKRAQSFATPTEVGVEPAVIAPVEMGTEIATEPEVAVAIAANELDTSPLPRQLEIEPFISAIEVPARDLAIPSEIFAEEDSKLADEAVQISLPSRSLLAKPILVASGINAEAEEEDIEETDFDGDWDDEDDADDDDAGDDDADGDLLNLVPRRSDVPKVGERVKILPLSAASLPKVCYLVIDKSSELIARPLKDFSDLGNIPDSEVQEKTLPVFPNHRVAMRFSNRSQKVIKVPDSGVFQTTSSQLQAKGITRLLVNGQVYSLGNADLYE